VLGELDTAWEARWPTTPPVGFLLRGYHADRWIRFHTLPDSKRYPESENEYATILNRHHTLLEELGYRGRCYVIASFFEGPDIPPVSPDETGIPKAERWRSLPPPEGEDEAMVAFAGEMQVPSSQLDLLLRDIIDDTAASTTLIAPAGDWLYHPYDGGADVIAPTAEARDRLRDRHREWLPAHPRGL
jgi:hypothetical protein